MLYPKINSLWKRQGWYLDEGKKHNRDYQAGRQSFIIGDYACDEFPMIKKWRVEEKIDGTNIRVTIYNDSCIEFGGRTDDAMLPAHLYKYLTQTFTPGLKELLFKLIPSATKIVLFGEGYGPKIQKGGGNYRDDVGFILFDCWAGSRWSTRQELKELAVLLNLPTPYDYGLMTEEEIIELVKSKPNSLTAVRPMTIEGVICRSEPLMIANLDNRPIMWKLKCKEF
jgi:ATP-dependent RNA circularization protein (DNA/RNA ligase family)